jgi:hypothetical protein
VVFVVVVLIVIIAAVALLVSRRRADPVDSFRRQIDALSPEARRPTISRGTTAADTSEPDPPDAPDAAVDGEPVTGADAEEQPGEAARPAGDDSDADGSDAVGGPDGT